MQSHRELVAPAVSDESHRTFVRVIDMESYRTRLMAIRRDSWLNAQWDELTRLTLQAWTWRDPDSLAALEGHIVGLKAHILEDWQR